MSKTIMNIRQAKALVRSAVAAGVEWCGINVEAARPMMGCDPGNERASLMLTRLLAACETDWKAMNEALWDYAMEKNPEDFAAGKQLVVTLGGTYTKH